MIKLKKLVNEALSTSEADLLLRKYGVKNASSLSKRDLKKAWLALTKIHHPDKEGGHSEKMKDINSAYDVLKTASPSSSEKNKWGFTGDASSTNEKDINYVKRKAWELSGMPTPTMANEYTFWNWDGRFFRGVVTVTCLPEAFFEISELVVNWDDHFKSVAVFVIRKSETHGNGERPRNVYLVNLRGQKVAPKAYEFTAFNSNPGNDRNFTRELEKSL